MSKGELKIQYEEGKGDTLNEDGLCELSRSRLETDEDDSNRARGSGGYFKLGGGS